MKVLIVGGGGREHALGWRISQSPQVEKLYFAPGNAGTSLVGENIDIGVGEIEKLKNFALKNKIDLTVVGPEASLKEGIVDEFSKTGLRIFGPSKNAAKLETDKAWAIKFMQRHNILHPESIIFNNPKDAFEFAKNSKWKKYVIKASGLAAGKGVILPNSLKEAKDAIKRIMVKKEFDEGKKIIFQERLSGKEVSLLALTDGKTVIPMISAQDHKRVFDNDKGPNTGGMGAFAPTPTMNDKLLKTVLEKILKPTVKGMKKEGNSYQGVLYAGLMITKNGPKVLEFNCRFGDPETQPLMMLISSDFFITLKACTEGKLKKDLVIFRKGCSLCVVLSSKGYPGEYEKGKIIYGLDKIPRDIQVFQAGTKIKNGHVVTNGGRVLGIIVYAKTIEKAREKVYSVINGKQIHFIGMHYRKDIGTSIND